MQQLLGNHMVTHWYFALGSQQKTSLSIQYCRQNNFDYFNNPKIQQLKQSHRNAIIQGTHQLFLQLQKIKPELHVIFFGKNFSVQYEKKIRRQYLSIGYVKNVPQLNYAACRKSLNPNIILVYGPILQQNYAVASTLAYNLSYIYSELPQDHNNFITYSDKTKNYVVNGLFTDPKSIKILDQYFNIRIIHLKYNRQDLPKFTKYFDQQHDLIPHLKDKTYYLQIKGDDDPVTIMDNVGIKLCPKLMYLNSSKNQHRDYVNKYIEETDGLVISIFKIQAIRKRKNLPLIQDTTNKISKINQILYKDLNRPEIFLADFPWHTSQFITIEEINRKFSYFIDLIPASKYQYSKEYSSPIYFLQNQTRIAPFFDLSLKDQLSHHVQYWIVNGTGTCGKTSIAKYIAAEFGYKLIQFQTQAAAAKQKIASPEDGDEVPVRKYIAYFANIIKNNPNNVYIFDSLPYTNTDLQQWVHEVGTPNVINLKAQPAELIKRARKKAEADVNAEVTEEETAKVNQNIQKNNQWVEKLGEYCPSSKIYQIDYSIPQILAQPLVNSILKPRIFLVQKNNHLVYQNIALKYNMGFINLNKNPLRSCANLVKKCGKRDIILCYYGQHEENLISQDMYWIEKNLGDIRYLGIWEPQQTEVHQSKMKLERPPQPIKPKLVEGQQKQQQPPAQGDQQGKPKKVFDIYQYEWTEPVNHKNLSQWFFKLKNKITKKIKTPKACYNYFQQILDGLNNDKDSNFYQIIK